MSGLTFAEKMKAAKEAKKALKESPFVEEIISEEENIIDENIELEKFVNVNRHPLFSDDLFTMEIL